MKLVCLILGVWLVSPLALAEPVQLSPKSDVNATLDALHARGAGLKDFAGNVTMTTVDERTGASFAQSGKVYFQNREGDNGRIRVSFDKRKLENGAAQDYRQEYLLADGWLTDRDYRKKLEVRRQVLKPGQKMNLLKLGEGPFPLPIGQPREEVKKLFDVSKVEPDKDDPKDTVHLKLVPKANTQFAKQFRQIDVFVSTKTNMPVRVDTTEKAGNSRVTDLSDLKINTGVSDKDFELGSIENQGWNRREEPY